MIVTRLKLKNWRNFREIDVPLGPRTYVIGANASGKSNLLDVFRFLRALAQADGGGLQKAVKERGGLGKLRSLHARKDSELRIEVELAESSQGDAATWVYRLAFNSDGKTAQRVAITEESVWHEGREIIARPNDLDRQDPERLTQTHLEQINNNAEFRSIVEFFAATTYLHLVPQLLRYGSEIGHRILENDPFGQGLMQRIAKTPKRTREAHLRRIEKTLGQAVPLFSELRFEQDKVTGVWHLEANFKHWRPHGAWQQEDQLSDGTLRLVGLLWALLESEGLLLLEEPELSLNDGIVQHIPLLIDRVLRDRRKRQTRVQVLISTHSEILLSQIMDAESILLIETGSAGSTVHPPDAKRRQAMEHGLNAAEVFLPETSPAGLEQLGLFG